MECPEMARRLGRATIAACWLLAPMAAHAQAAPATEPAPLAEPAPPAEPAPASAEPSAQPVTPSDGTPAGQTLEQRLEALAAQVQAQQQEIERQRKELEAQRVVLDSRASEDATVSDEQLAGLLEGGDPIASFEPRLSIYGFAEAGLQRAWGGMAESGMLLTDATNFVLGSANVYLDAEPVQNWRFLLEVNFTLFPHGAEQLSPAGDLTQVNAEILDYTSAAGGFTNVRYNVILLERAHIDWTPHDAINVRAGLFLTPYGIWNVDHGAPTLIMARQPLMTSIEIFPERQLGVDIFGRFHLEPWELGYHLYVSNGRMIGAVDFDDDKAIGGRVYAKTRRPFPMQYGFSFFTGSSENEQKMTGVTGSGDVGLVRNVIVAFDEYGFAADASLDIGALRLRVEGATRTQVFETGKRTLLAGVPTSDVTWWGGYALAAYRLPWWGLEPLVAMEILRFPTVIFGEAFVVPSGGLNIYFSAATMLRMQYAYAKGVDFEDLGRNLDNVNLHMATARLIVAFQ